MERVQGVVLIGWGRYDLKGLPASYNAAMLGLLCLTSAHSRLHPLQRRFSPTQSLLKTLSLSSSRSLKLCPEFSRWGATWKPFQTTNTPKWNTRPIGSRDLDHLLQQEHLSSVCVEYVIYSFEYVFSSPHLYSCSPPSTKSATPLSSLRA